MDAKQLEDLCDRWLDAWRGNEPERLLAFYAPDTYYEDPARPAGLRGHAELSPYFERLLAAYPDWVWTRKSLHPIEGGFCVTHEARIPIGEETLVERCMDLVLLNDAGKIMRNEVYFDTSRWNAMRAKRA